MIQLPDTTTEQGQRQASALLAKAMGVYSQLFDDCVKFRFRGDDVLVCVFPHHHGWYRVTEDNDAFHHSPYPEGRERDIRNDEWRHFVNFYEPTNMSLLWRVLNWASENVPHFSKWWHDVAVVTIQDLPPVALSAFLSDNILRLANEGGMIDGISEE